MRAPIFAKSSADYRSNRRVVVADDCLDTARAVGQALEMEGFEVRIATDGIEVLRHVAEFSPAILILDLQMPKLDGFDVCPVVRSRAIQNDVRVIALSGHTLPEDRERSLAAGFDVHLAKPLEPSALFEAILGLYEDGEVPG
jgi:CheY-like chemotaxis protein